MCLISSLQQSDAVIYIYMCVCVCVCVCVCIFHYGLSQDIEYICAIQ